MLMRSIRHSKCTQVCTPTEWCLTASSKQLQKTHCMHYLQAATSRLPPPHVCPSHHREFLPPSRSSLVTTLLHSEMNPLSSAERPDDQSVQQQQQLSDREPPPASGDPWLCARQPGNEDMQPQLDCTPVQQQPKHKGSSRQQREQQVQATEQLLQFNQHHPIQLGGQQALVDGQQVPDERQQVQPQGQSEEGRPSRQTEKPTGQKKHRKKKQQGPSQQQQSAVMQREGAIESSRVQGGLAGVKES
ncbi:TPA: hypothetical protein ACH3X1_005473 [Trebouxia sp. C0004]